MGKATGGVMLLQHSDLFAESRQAGGGGETANAGANDNSIIGAIEPGCPVATAHAKGAGLQLLLVGGHREALRVGGLSCGAYHVRSFLKAVNKGGIGRYYDGFGAGCDVRGLFGVYSGLVLG
jgi:hypothetical protein